MSGSPGTILCGDQVNEWFIWHYFVWRSSKRVVHLALFCDLFLCTAISTDDTSEKCYMKLCHTLYSSSYFVELQSDRKYSNYKVNNNYICKTLLCTTADV